MHARAACILLLACMQPAFAQQRCPPRDANRQTLQQLQQRNFEVADDDQRARLAFALLPCLASTDPVLRDDIAFSAYSTWLRGKLLDISQLRTLRERLYQMLDAEDAQGFRRPFAALTLSEIARTDRIEPWMSGVERDAMVQKAVAYLQSVRDYRGLDAKQGWRHGVAHGSDWLLQLALNPALQRLQLDAMLGAVAAQVMPATHAYEFGEPARLGRPVLYIAARGQLSAADWGAWFSALIADLGDSRAYKDVAWLTRRHGLHAFLTSLYVAADQAQEPPIHALKEPVSVALGLLP